MATMRSLVLTMITAATLVACGGESTSSAVASADALSAKTPLYLALGDSVAFGDNPLLRPVATNPNPFVGYPTFVAELVDVPLVNAACPGQTTFGFFDLGGTDNGCFAFREEIGLHTSYEGAQLAFAQEFLVTYPGTQLVTVALGANDLYLLLDECRGDFACVQLGAGEVLTSVGRNMGYVLASLRGTGYTGQIVVPLYYSPSPDPTYRFLVSKLNEAVGAAAPFVGATVVDLLAPFDEASSDFGLDACAAGLLIPLPGGGCDIHPTEAGARLIAQTIAAAVPARAE